MILKSSGAGESTVVTIRQGPLAGMKMRIDSLTPHYYWLKGHDELHVLNAIQEIVKPGDRVIDVGAHVGTETLFLSKCVGPDGHVLSIEPDPGNFDSLWNNIILNSASNVQLLQVAVSDRSGQMQLIKKGVLSHLKDDRSYAIDEGELITLVKVTTLDELFAGKPDAVDFVKIDVEDFEAHVLHGASKFISEKKPCIIVELHSYSSAKACADIFLNLGYKIEVLNTSERDIFRYLEKQPKVDFMQGFMRCHLLAKP